MHGVQKQEEEVWGATAAAGGACFKKIKQEEARCASGAVACAGVQMHRSVPTSEHQYSPFSSPFLGVFFP
jgi:hypothetical protein